MGSGRLKYHVYDQSMSVVFTGTEVEIVKRFNWDKLRLRWAINHTVEIHSMYVIDSRVDNPSSLIEKQQINRERYV